MIILFTDIQNSYFFAFHTSEHQVRTSIPTCLASPIETDETQHCPPRYFQDRFRHPIEKTVRPSSMIVKILFLTNELNS